jgi:hypothetical protein
VPRHRRARHDASILHRPDRTARRVPRDGRHRSEMQRSGRRRSRVGVSRMAPA